jgi:hypothetical protein
MEVAVKSRGKQDVGGGATGDTAGFDMPLGVRVQQRIK